jgi:magnesium-transporting ATPase (P-type)
MTEPIYRLRVAEVYKELDSSPAGLPDDEAEARLGLYGPNRLEELPRPQYRRQFTEHLLHTMAIILWAAGLLAILAGDLPLGIFIWIVVLVNALFSFWQEYQAERKMDALRSLLPSYARVMRNATAKQIPTDQVVPGDVLILAEGDHIPADARVIEEYGLRTNNANLTGEAVPARKTADPSLIENMSELERPNLIFAGTSIAYGTGRAMVFSTGMATQFGRIAHLTQEVSVSPSPIQLELKNMIYRISWVALGIGAIIFFVGAFDLGLPVREAFLLALGIIVALVPEGLPATVTLTLAIAGQRLAQRGVFIKQLSTIETLGNVSVICTDKSGTLTQNQMTVKEVWVGGDYFSVGGGGYEPIGSYSPDPTGSPREIDLISLLRAASLCNNSRLNPPSDEKPYWSCLGDQTEAALRVAALKYGTAENEIENCLPRIHELPFDARRKRMSTIHMINTKGGLQHLSGGCDPPGATSQSTSPADEIALVKGAPREIIQLCTSIQINGVTESLSEDIRKDLYQANDRYARNALRVLALAYRELPPRSGYYTPENVEQDLTFLGLMAMMDPPRPEVANAVEILHSASIRMVMITGDYGLTAESLARRIGLLSTPNPSIITGAEFENLTDFELKRLLSQEVIYARMAPEHKLRLVMALQEQGEVVAVTGDGVNDAPALRRADIGVVMGVTGTDVAKEAADVILATDNFAYIVNAIEEGRAVYENIRKFMTYIFSSNVPEVLPFLMTGLFNMPLALSVRQILAIDLGTDLFPALALGTEKPEPNIMQKPPRLRTQPLIDRTLVLRAFFWLGMIEAVICTAGFLFVYNGDGVIEIINNWLPGLQSIGITLPSESNLTLAMTVYFAGVVIAQVANSFACRSERQRSSKLGWLSNRLLIQAVIFEFLLLLAFIYLPPLQEILQNAPLPWVYWLGLFAGGLALYILEWIRKLLVSKLVNRNGIKPGRRNIL